MIAAIEYRVRLAIRRTMFGVASGILLFVGIAFLAVAGWIALSAFFDTLQLALIFGGIFVGLGLIMLAMTRTNKAAVKWAPSVNYSESTAAPAAGMAALGGIGAAFAQGISAGMSAGKGKPPPEEHHYH
jgi:uncharacterized membrane protein YeiB